MKLSKQTLVGSLLAVALMGPTAVQAQSRLRIERAASPTAPAASFSAEVPLVGRNVPLGGGQSNTLVLNAVHPFNVTLSATDVGRTGNSGPGVALPQTDIFGYFSIPALTFNPSNPEVFIKLLDARSINGKYWVFFGGLTDLFYTLTITENATGLVKTYTHAQGTALGGFDTSAFSATVSSNLEDVRATEITPASIARTSIDITNNTSTAIAADLQYAYICTAPTCSPVGAFARTAPKTIQLAAFAGFHQDDLVQYLANNGVALNTGALLGSYGTFLVTFNGVFSNIGWEATIEARNYARVSEVDPLRGTIGYGENASLFFESTNTTLVGNARDTRSAPTLEGSLLTQVGIRNTDVLGVNNPSVGVSVDLTLFNAATGLRVGNTIPLNNIQPGEVRLVGDLFTAAAVPSTVSSVIVFADTRGHPSNAPTIEGFLLVQDTQSLDSRFHELKCAAPVRCGP